MLKLGTRLLMILSWFYYLFILSSVLHAGLLGNVATFWESLDFPKTLERPPIWSIVAGICFTAVGLFGLFRAYWSVEKIVGRLGQIEFPHLALGLRQMASGLLLFWFGYNLMSGLFPVLATAHVSPSQALDLSWDPLDIDIVFVVLAISLYAISQAVERASEVEEENKLFM